MPSSEAPMMLSPTESEFDRQIHILASVRHIKEHASRPPPQCTSVEKKHLELLDHIALLLVTKSRGDVAAVTMEITATSLKFYFAKNKRCDPSTLSFVNRMLKIIKEEPLKFMHKSMLMIVMVECVEKVRARIKKSQNALEEAGEINIPQSSPYINSGNVLKLWGGLDNSQIISSFLIELRTFITATPIMRSNPGTSMWLCIKAHLIGNSKLLADYPTLDRRIRKMGAYCGAVMQITSLLEIPAYNKLLPYLTFELNLAYNPQTTNNFSQAAHPIHQTVQIPISVCTLLNEDAKKQDEEYVTDEDVKTKYPELTVATTNNATVTTSDHCELTLALNAIKSGPTSSPIKIGVSKRICWLCERYLDFLSETKGVRILISEYQGKIHSGWRVPAHSPEDVKMIMHNLVRREITEIREQIIGRRKSDSFPPEYLKPIAEEDPDIVSKYHNFS